MEESDKAFQERQAVALSEAQQRYLAAVASSGSDSSRVLPPFRGHTIPGKVFAAEAHLRSTYGDQGSDFWTKPLLLPDDSPQTAK